MPSLPQSMVFQSTLPLRGVTVSRFWSWIACRRFQSTLPLRGATRRRRPVPSGLAISIHTPLAGSDLAGHAGIAGTGISIHTPLAGSDRNVTVFVCGLYAISIHTPLAGSDMPPVTAGLNRLFQSTLPLRGATSTRYPRHPRNRFQSTLPLRGATRGRTGARLHRSISIHTPLAGSDFLIYANS